MTSINVIMIGIRLLCIWSLCFDLLTSKEMKVDTFIKENIKDLNIKDHKCRSSKVSYLLWLKTTSIENALFCSFSILKEKKVSDKERQLIWMLVHDAYKEKKLTKKKNFALKQSSNIAKKVNLKQDWYFLGPFQIGKPELDGNPIESLDNVTLKRWDFKMTVYSELMKAGVLKWSIMQSDSSNVISIQPEINWNDLVMSLQSMAVTEWQGLLVNEFAVFSDDTELFVQCMGVNIFYIDDVPINGDIYHRSEYWYPVLLNTGVHIIKVPVRTKGHTSIQCNVKQQKKKVVAIHQVRFAPDLVDNNWFSFHCAVTATNLSPLDPIEVTNIAVKNTDLIDANIEAELIDTTIFQPGQVNSIIFKFIPSSSKEIFTKCKRTSYFITLTLKFSNSKREELKVPLRCRNSDQSFLFTYLDHDGSVQHAAAIRPLKPCLLDYCPVLLTMHGTGVSAQNQADSYKRMVKNKFLFGVEKLWLLAPTRFGAHNWEGPGELTSMEALKALATLSKSTSWLSKPADESKVVFAGHSMGGHGAWQLSIHNPDKALAVISAAGWLSKEDYGDSNVLYRHDVSVSHTDPSIKAIQESCVAENQADKHASNLKGIPVMIRIGADDKTVHPYFSRRMFRLLKEYNVNVTYKELAGKEHWWWDTKSENDGGVTNDVNIRTFATYAVEKLEMEGKKECDVEGECSSTSMYTHHQESRSSGKYTFVVYNPASFNGGRGVMVLLQKIPFRISKYTIKIDQSNVDISTTNIQSLLLYESQIEPIRWKSKLVTFNGVLFGQLQGDAPWQFCLAKSQSFELCEEGSNSQIRGPTNYGPARRIAEHHFIIVICNNGKEADTNTLKRSATLLANLFLLTSDARVNIYSSTDVSREMMDQKNVIVIGIESCVQAMGLKQLIQFEKKSIKLGDCVFNGEDYSALYILPHANKLMLMLTGHNVGSIAKNIMSLALPTIPPMTRSPFSNLVPDYVILSSDVHKMGPGGYACVGFWNNDWEYDSASSSCSC